MGVYVAGWRGRGKGERGLGPVLVVLLLLELVMLVVLVRVMIEGVVMILVRVTAVLNLRYIPLSFHLPLQSFQVRAYPGSALLPLSGGSNES